ncbi:MAG: hemerythrin domain-containing protein [Methanomassiliicoccales archaeon]|nr:hemerythrin domain-containing protein [Methanomassiliicoccales archaeon]
MRISVTLLQYDHGIVRQVLDVIGEIVRTHRTSKHMAEMKEMIDFLEQFLDRFHHAKEEKFFFPAALEECPKMTETMNRLVEEHRQARRMIVMALDAVASGDVSKVEERSRELVEHMTRHITEEENHVFPAVENDLREDTDLRIREQYDHFMEEGFGSDYYQTAEAFANEIQDRVLGAGFFKGIA